MTPLPLSTPAPSAGLDRQTITDNLQKLRLLLLRHNLADEAEKVDDKLRDFAAPNELLIFVVGEGNFGKSSLINALAGREVAPVSFLPKTWKVDLYQSADMDYALVRRKGEQYPVRFSADDAQAQCAAQEKEIVTRETDLLAAENADRDAQGLPALTKRAFFENHAPVVLSGQIVEVRWFLSDLELPPHVVLVDTPGMNQVRSGMASGQAQTLGGTHGITFDLQELYEQFYHRADLVLWAFRADKLNDRDTINAFTELQNRKTNVIGVITYADKVPLARRETELLPNAKRYFGHGVETFVPVICGGPSPEKGLGISVLQTYLRDLSARAEPLKCAATETFCGVQADFAGKHLASIGDTLIYNITQLSLYCNATSGSLLEEVNTRSEKTVGKYFEDTKIPPFGTEAEIRKNLEEFAAAQGKPIHAILHSLANHDSIRFSVFGVSDEKVSALAELYRQEVAKFLFYDAFNAKMREDLHQTGEYVKVQGRSIASGRRMRQVILQAGGKSKTQSLDARIEPPDIDDIKVDLPHIEMPPLPGGFASNIFRMFGGADVKPEALEAAVITIFQQAAKIIVAFVECNETYTKRAAQAILQSADAALHSVYPSETFTSLSKQAEQMDEDLWVLDALVPQGLESTSSGNYRFLTLFRIWSPRDDVRVAALDYFCEWFTKKWPTLKTAMETAAKPRLADYALDTKKAQRACASVLANEGMTNQWNGAAVGTLTRRSEALNQLMTQRRDSVAQMLASLAVFDQNDEKTMLPDFDYLSLEGIPGDLAQSIADSFIDTDKEKGEAQQLPALRSDAVEARPLWQNASAVAGASAVVGSVLGFATAPSFFPSGLMHTVYLGVEPVAFTLVGGGVGYQVLKMRRTLAHRQNVAAQMADHINKWTEANRENHLRAALDSLTIQKVRSIAGRKTLVQKRPLDYAIEGAFDEYNKR